MSNLKWDRNKETGEYSSVTGRWKINKVGSKSWKLEDSKQQNVYQLKSLQKCKDKAEQIFIEEKSAPKEETNHLGLIPVVKNYL